MMAAYHAARPVDVLPAQRRDPPRHQRGRQNPVLTATYTQVNARLQALRFRSNQDGEKWKRAVQEHEQMIDALEARDALAMRAVLQTHLDHKRDVVLEQLRAMTPENISSVQELKPMNAPLPIKRAVAPAERL